MPAAGSSASERHTPGTQTTASIAATTGQPGREARGTRASCRQRTTGRRPAPASGLTRSPGFQGRSTRRPGANHAVAPARSWRSGADSACQLTRQSPQRASPLAPSSASDSAGSMPSRRNQQEPVERPLGPPGATELDPSPTRQAARQSQDSLGAPRTEDQSGPPRPGNQHPLRQVRPPAPQALRHQARCLPDSARGSSPGSASST